jgi:hypothetical protein
MNREQQETNAESYDNHVICASPDKIIFRESSLVQELHLHIKKSDGSSIGNERIIQIEVKRNLVFQDHILAEPGKVLEGDLLVIPTLTTLKVLTSNHGFIRISFKARPVQNNGYIKVFSKGAEEVFIYCAYQ